MGKLKRAKSIEPISLANLIATVKQELRNSAQASKGDKMFKVADVTLDIAVKFCRSSKLGASLAVSAEVVDSAEASHRIQIRIVPAQTEEIKTISLSDPESPMIQGTS